MNLGLEGRIAVVTGASRGLGLAAARALAREGARVALGARSEADLAAAKESIERDVPNADVFTAPLDVVDPASIEAFAEAVRTGLGDADVLVTNAGGPPSGTYDQIDVEQYGPALDLCFLFAVRLFDRFLPSMRERGFGRIVHVASISAREPLDGLILSNASRAAAVGFAKTVANQVAKDGVTVNVLLPGFTATDRTIELADAIAARDGTTPDAVRAAWEANIPAGRLARPEEFADVVAFLCSENASYVTGTAVAVDGGYLRGI